MSNFDTQDTRWSVRAARERQLTDIDELLRSRPDAIDAQVERANLLNVLDRQVESRDAFIEILQKAPTDFRALNEFVVANPPDERWAYRRPAVNKIINAVKAMIIRAAAPAATRKAG